MKNYFIANGEYLNTEMSIDEIEARAQEALDNNTSGMAKFFIKEINEKEVWMFFVRDFICNPNDFIVYDTDMSLISGLGIGAFQLQPVGGYPLIFPLNFDGRNFYTDITAFIRFYKHMLFMELGQTVEHIGLRTYSDRILMQIIF